MKLHRNAFVRVALATLITAGAASHLTAQDTPPFLNLAGELAGASGAPEYRPKGIPYQGHVVNHTVTNLPPFVSGAFYLGASRADIHRFGGILVPSPDTIVLATSNAAGKAQVALAWPALLPDTECYAQFLFFDGTAPQGASFSNAARIHTFADQAEVDYWQTMTRTVAAEYGGLANTRPLAAQELALVMADPRVGKLQRAASRTGGVRADSPRASVCTYRNAHRTQELVVIPLVKANGQQAGAAFLYDLTNPLGLATAVVPGNSTGTSMFFYGTNGDEVRLDFRGDHKFLGATETFHGTTHESDAWEDFKRWLSSESGAEDLPWWLDLLCGIACGDALVGTHNPWSISGCLHCVGAYIAACIQV